MLKHMGIDTWQLKSAQLTGSDSPAAILPKKNVDMQVDEQKALPDQNVALAKLKQRMNATSSHEDCKNKVCAPLQQAQTFASFIDDVLLVLNLDSKPG